MSSLPGSALRDHIARFLRLKFKTVDVEKRLAATTADVFFVEDTNHLFPQKIAIEAKDWKKALTSADIAAIYNLYAPSLSIGASAKLAISG